MKYLPLLTEDEARYICSVIPYEHTINYFQKNPKEFAKICPGFRAKAISKSRASKLLFQNRKRHFVSSFLEDHINDWLSQIQEHLNKCIEAGDSKDLAYIHTLPFSFFADNVALYFKLNNEECPEDYMALLTTSVAAIKETNEEQQELQGDLKTQESVIKQLQIEIEMARTRLKKSEEKQSEQSRTIKKLKASISGLNKLQTTVKNDKKVIAALNVEIQKRGETIQELRAEASDLIDSSEKLEAQIRTEFEKQKTIKIAEQEVVRTPKCPNDIEEFKDFLGFNLVNIGVPADSEYFVLLKEHLSNILFQGVPVVINRSIGKSIMNCVANTLIGQQNVHTLVFSKGLTGDDVDSFLASAERVVNLDNFIGNCNETELLPLFDKHRDKVTFLTGAYDRTINYVSGEFLRYCHYLNLNRIAALFANAELTEDPSTIEEVELQSTAIYQENRYSSLLREMLGEYGYLPCLVEPKCASISDERDLCRVLAFDVLPYCVDVLHISPYNTSERLIKYAGDSGRCPYKNLFKGWFA